MPNPGTMIAAEELIRLIGTEKAPRVVDVRRRPAYEASDRVIAGARWRDHRTADRWGHEVAAGRPVVVYCAHGEQVGISAASLLRSAGIQARALSGGFDAFAAAGGPTIARAALPPGFEEAPTRWVTRERPKVDRIACPWFVRRFVDPEAAIHYVHADWVRDAAVELDAIPFDVEGVELTHRGELCSFDALLDRFGVEDAALRRLARIVRGADTARPDLEPQAAGLLAVALGVSAAYDDDHEALARGMVVYDALYAWCRFAAGETHDWVGRTQ